MSQPLKIPVVVMRGGTSRGPYFLAGDLPADTAARDRVLIAAMGSGSPLQVDGIGGGNPLTSKVAIVSRSTRAGADVDYLFAQVDIMKAIVDTKPNCGNMLAGVGPFAIEAGLVTAQDGETPVRIFNINTETAVTAIVQTPARQVRYDGDFAIDGVPGTAAPISLVFSEAAGAVTGQLLPTGKAIQTIQGVDVSVVDYAMPIMLVRARDVGISGDEKPEMLDANTALFARLESMRLEAGQLMGLGDVSNSVVPKIALLSAAKNGGTIRSIYLTPKQTHRAHAVTGALCVAVATKTPGTLATEFAADGPLVIIEHPSGKIEIELQMSPDGSVARAGVMRTARRILEGKVIVPPHVPAGKKSNEETP